LLAPGIQDGLPARLGLFEPHTVRRPAKNDPATVGEQMFQFFINQP
jgi:hypothetical protein